MREQHSRGFGLVLLATVCVLSSAACSDAAPDGARVYFKTDAPFCSKLFIEKSIDGVAVARDTMANDRLSVAYLVPPGRHVLSARVISVSVSIPFTDTTVTLAANDSATRVLPFYCS